MSGNSGAREGTARRVFAGLKVLLVEDDPALARATARVLLGLGAVVETTARVGRALHHLDSGRFHLVLTDFHLERETSEVVVKAAAERALPCVILTGLPTAVPREVRELAPILEKPYEIGALEAVVALSLRGAIKSG